MPFLRVFQTYCTYQRFSHDHLDLLLGQHSELCKQTLDDELPRLELGVNGDAGHSCDVVFLPRQGRDRGGGATSTRAAAADWGRSCGGDGGQRLGDKTEELRRVRRH